MDAQIWNLRKDDDYEKMALDIIFEKLRGREKTKEK